MAGKKQHSKKATLENDYERMVPEFHKSTATYAEHMVRYGAVQELVAGKTVLDIASGSGYGTAMIAKSAKKVYGVDVSEDAITYAQEYYGAKNIEYKVGDGERIPLPDASVDIVVSFETIEHIADYEQFVAETKRVLKNDGLLVLSTPNDKEFVEGNHFHLHEFEYDELRSLVKKYYKNITAYFQGDWVATALFDERMTTKEWTDSVPALQLSPLAQDQVLYFFLLCANRSITETVQPTIAFGEHWSARSLQQLDRDHHTRRHEVEEYAQQLEERIHATDARLEQLAHDLKKAEQSLQRITSSRSWKVMRAASTLKRKVTRKQK